MIGKGFLGGILTVAARRSVIALVLAVLCCTAGASAASAASQTLSDPADVSPGAGDALSDVRAVTLSQTGDQTSVTLSMQAGKLNASTPYSGDVFLDTNRDGAADFDAHFVHDQKLPGTVGYQLLSASKSTDTCQQSEGGAVITSGKVDQTFDQQAGLLNSTFSFATSAIGGAQSLAWAVFGDTAEASPPDGWDYVPDATAPDPQAPNPGDETCGIDKNGASGWRLALGQGASFPPPETTPPTTTTDTTPTSTTPAPNTPITARLTVTTAAPTAGTLVGLNAGSTTSSSPVVSYDWDFNGDGHPDTSTGTNPVARQMFSPGDHTVTVTATNATGAQSTTTSTFRVGGSTTTSLNSSTANDAGSCTEELDLPPRLHLAAGCIRPAHDGGFDIVGGPIDVNGMLLFPRSGHSETFHLTVHNGVQLSGPAVNVELINTPIGDMVLGGLDLTRSPLNLSGIVAAPSSVIGGHASSAPSRNAIRLVTFAVGHDCASGSHDPTCCPPRSDTTACAKLPGNFPLAGQVNVSINYQGQALFDVQVALNLPSIGFSATGGLQLIADLNTGLHLSQLSFGVPNANLRFFRVRDASFTYHWPSSSTSPDSWQAQAKLFIGPASAPGPELDGELDFQGGVFHHAALTVTLPGGVGIPIFPGVLLNRFGGEVGMNPFIFGGTLGASIGSQLEASVSFRYREPTPETLGVFGLQGTLELSDTQIAQLAFDLYSDGYIDGALDLDLHFPLTADEDHQVASVQGHVGFWDEPSSGRYQATGSVHLHVWIIDGSAAVVVNPQWLSGCVSGGFDTPWGRVEGGLAGGYREADGHVEGYPFGGNCTDTDRLTHYEIAPTTTHSGGYNSRAADGSQPVALPGSTHGQELRVSGDGGVPVVQLTAPDGHTITTSTDTGKLTGAPAHDGLPAYLSAQGPQPDQLLISLPRAAGGVWKIAPAPGSPAITKVEIATLLPKPSITAQVLHAKHGGLTLVYRARDLGGSRVQFVARGRDSGQVIATTTKAAGRITFSPVDARGRKRRIEADLQNANGMPSTPIAVATFLAPRPVRPGRARGVRIVRRGRYALVTWGPAAHAKGYTVTVRGSDGRVEQFFTNATNRRVHVPNVFPFQTLRAVVVATAGPGDPPGPIARATLRRGA